MFGGQLRGRCISMVGEGWSLAWIEPGACRCPGKSRVAAGANRLGLRLGALRYCWQQWFIVVEGQGSEIVKMWSRMLQFEEIQIQPTIIDWHCADALTSLDCQLVWCLR